MTLLVLPLVDAAGRIGTTGVGTFLDDNKTKLLAFFLSFLVIARFWWEQHQVYERVKAYNGVLVAGMFIWLLSIVFLPFPTELLSSAQSSNHVASHALYVGTLLVAALAGLLQRWAIVHWKELQIEEFHDTGGMGSAVAVTLLIAVALIVSITIPSVGLWSLLLITLPGRTMRRVAFFRKRFHHHTR
jgi:uncharacterized membrane protein